MVVRLERSGTISFSADAPDARTTELTRAVGLVADCFWRRALVEHPSLAWPMVEVIAAIASTTASALGTSATFEPVLARCRGVTDWSLLVR